MHFFLLQGRLAPKKQPGLTLYQVAETLDAIRPSKCPDNAHRTFETCRLGQAAGACLAA